MAKQALKGQFNIKVLEGDTVVQELTQINTITDVGADYYAQFNIDSLLGYCAVGSDDSLQVPVVYQEFLGNEVARVDRFQIVREDPNNNAVDFVCDYILPAADPGFVPSWNPQITQDVPLDDDSGTTAVATVGSNGTYFGGFTLNQDDGFGDFSRGAPEFVNGGVTIPVTLFQQFAVFFRVKIQLGTANILFFEGDNEVICLGIERDTINLIFNNDVLLEADGLTLNTWYSVGIIVDRAVCTLYVDGVQRDSRTTRKVIPSISGTFRFGGTAFFGQFSDVVIANTYLTSAQVKEYFDNTNRRLPENQDIKEVGVSPFELRGEKVFSRAVIPPLTVTPTQSLLIEYRLTVEILTNSNTADTNQGQLVIVDEMQSKLGAIDQQRGGVLSPLNAGLTDILLTTVLGLSAPSDGLVIHTDGTELTREVNSTQDISQYLRLFEESFNNVTGGSSTYSTLSTIDPEHGADFTGNATGIVKTYIFKHPLNVYGFIITGLNTPGGTRGEAKDSLSFTVSQISGETYNFTTTDFGPGLGQFAQAVTALNDGAIQDGNLLYVGVNMAQTTFRVRLTFSQLIFFNEITIYNGQGNGNFNVFEEYSIYSDAGFSNLLYDKSSGVATTTENQDLLAVSALDTARDVYYLEFRKTSGSISLREIEVLGAVEPGGIQAIQNGNIYYRETLKAPFNTALTVGQEIDVSNYRYVYYIDPVKAQVLTFGDLQIDWSQVSSIIPLVFENDTYRQGQYNIEKPLEIPPVIANTVDGGNYREQAGTFNSLQLVTVDVYPSVDAVNPKTNVGYAAQFTPSINLTNNNRLQFFSTLTWGDPTISTDSDVVAYLNELGLDDLNVEVAISYLVTELKNEGLWDKLDVLYPVLDSQILNLKNPTASSESVVVSGNYLVSRRGIQPYDNTLLELPTVTLSGLLDHTLIVDANLSLDTDNYLLSANETGYTLDVTKTEINVVNDSRDIKVVNQIPTDGLVTWITPGNADATVQPVAGFGDVGVFNTLTSALGLNPSSNATQYLVTPGKVGYPGIWMDFNPISWSGLTLSTTYTVFLVAYRPVGSASASNTISVTSDNGTIDLKPQNTSSQILRQTTNGRTYSYDTTENVFPAVELILVTYRSTGGQSIRFNRNFDGYNVPAIRKNGTNIIDETSESGVNIGVGITGYPRTILNNATLTLDGEMILYDFLYYDYDMSDTEMIAVEKALSEKHNLSGELSIRDVLPAEELDIESNTWYLASTATNTLVYKNNVSTALLNNTETQELLTVSLDYDTEGNLLYSEEESIQYVINTIEPQGYVSLDINLFATTISIFDEMNENSNELANFGSSNTSGIFIYDNMDFASEELANITIGSGFIYDSMDSDSDELINLSGIFGEISPLYYENANILTPPSGSAYLISAVSNPANQPLYYEYETVLVAGLGNVRVGTIPGNGEVTSSGIFFSDPLYYQHDPS